MFFAMVYRGPSLPGEIRGWFEVFFEIALSMSLAAIIWNYNKWIAMFLVLVTVSMFYPRYGIMSYMAGRAVFNGCLWYLFVVMFFSVHNLNTLYRMLRIFVYFHVSVALFQYLEIAGWLSVPVVIGLMANPLELSALVSFCLPAFLDLKGRRVLLVVIPVGGIFIAGQSLGFLSLFVGAAFYLWLRYKMYFPGIALIILITSLWVFKDLITLFFDHPGNELSVSVTNRLYVWKRAIMTWKQHWIMGSGIGHWKVVFSKPMLIDGKRWVTTHNEFLQMLFELGIGAAIIFIGYAVDVLRKMTRQAVIPLTAMVMITVYSAASFPIHIAPTAMVAVTWAAVLQIVTDEVKNHERDHSVNSRGYPGFCCGVEA